MKRFILGLLLTFSTHLAFGASTLFPAITVSSNSVVGPNGTPLNIASTRTSGFQEAINSTYQAANVGMPGGNTIFVGPGIFYIQTNLWYSNNLPGTIKIKGQGITASAIVCTASNIAGILNVTQDSAGPNRAVIELEDIALGSLTNAMMPLVRLDKVTSFNFHRTAFTYWPAWTNNNANGGAPAGVYGLTFYIWNGYTNMDLVGIQAIDVSDYSTLEECFLYSMAVALDPSGIDHGNFCRNMFYFNGQPGTNHWHQTNSYSIGGAVVANRRAKTIQSWLFQDNYFYGDYAAYVVTMPAPVSGNQVSMSDHYESCDSDFIFGSGNSWIVINRGRGGFANTKIVSGGASGLGTNRIVGAAEDGRIWELKTQFRGGAWPKSFSVPGLTVMDSFPTNFGHIYSITITNATNATVNGVYTNQGFVDVGGGNFAWYYTNFPNKMAIIGDIDFNVNSSSIFELWTNDTEIYGLDPWNGTWPVNVNTFSGTDYTSTHFPNQRWFPTIFNFGSGPTPDWYINWTNTPTIPIVGTNAIFYGDGSGLTNITLTLVQTNFISGMIYSNFYGAPIEVSCNAVLTEAGVTGVSVLEARAIGTQTNYSAQLTAATIIAGSITNHLAVKVPVNGTYTFTNTSTGAGNSSKPVGGQILVF